MPQNTSENLIEESRTQFIKMLDNLSAICDKAAQYADAKKFDAAVLLTARLAPDQFPFTRQVQVASDMAKGMFSRLAGQEPPKWEDGEQTIGDIKGRIKKTIDHLKSFKPDQFIGYEARRITLPRGPEGKSLSAVDYVHQFVVPNFYFHVTTAYAILRHNGVDLGKMDFIGSLPFQS